ncbi:hypothetical protein MtrunA17_Chr3g0134081 [Medicago truncatula]|uniref:Uncharacterized protein n=1 Tax=Medicago truncatula TaxID=3880 RepID=A0A396J0S4_MEDTR|nr:hypothetical protein MtrunA17_Chr3g0134081 [Medicago truncatula]
MQKQCLGKGSSYFGGSIRMLRGRCQQHAKQANQWFNALSRA